MTRVLNKLRGVFAHRHRDEEIRDELDFHLNEEISAHKAAGLNEVEARTAARRDLGNRARVEEDVRAAWSWRWIGRLAQDLRYAWRMVRRRPAFTIAAVTSLALGIGANTAVFSLLHALVLEQLPVARPHELVRLTEGVRDGSVRDTVTWDTFDTLRRGSTTLSHVFAVTRTFARPGTVEERGEKTDAFIQLVSDNFFESLGVDAIVGRVFRTPPPDSAGEPIVVISDAYWRQRYGSDPNVVGRRIRVWKRDVTIAGVAQPGFGGVEMETPIDIWAPFDQLVAADAVDRTRGRWMRVMGRVAAEGTLASASAEASAILARPVSLESGATGYSTLRVALMRPLLLVEAVAGLVLLVACANLANLLLAGTAARAREIAVRSSLGASRARVVMQLCTESIVLALAGGVLAVGVASWVSAALLSFLPSSQAPALGTLTFQLNWPVLAFTLVLSAVTCVLFGLWPALRATRLDEAVRLRSGAGASQPSRGWTSRGLVICQVALCVLLLMVAIVFVRSLQNLRGQDAGYRADRLLVADVGGPIDYPEERRDQLVDELRSRLGALPGVEAVAYSHHGQLSGGAFEYVLGFPGRVETPHERLVAIEQRVTPGFFGAMGTRLVAGRDVSATDTASSTPVAIVNEAFVAQFFSGVNPIGRRFYQEGGSRARQPMEVIGVVSNAKWVSLRDDAPAMYYRPYAQQSGSPVVRLAVRATSDVDLVAGALRQIAQSIDRRMTVGNVMPFDEVVDRTLVVERLVAQVSTAFGALALAIAALGLYGVLAYSVARRRREIGVRIAVGASPGVVERMILRESLTLFAVGCTIGIPLAIAITRRLSSMLFELSPQDPLAVVVSIGTLGLATTAASYFPARRAAATDPTYALRAE
jgi:predicted permease